MTAEVVTAVDADGRLAELRAVREILLPDVDDPRVLSEIVSVEAELPDGNPNRTRFAQRAVTPSSGRAACCFAAVVPAPGFVRQRTLSPTIKTMVAILGTLHDRR